MKFTLPSTRPARGRARSKGRAARPGLELLEPRLAPYSASGNAWPHPELITISFMPDGTSVNGKASNLFAAFNAKFGSAAAWQNQILKAAQVWAQQTNLNFAVVPDNGATSGSGGYQQGDPGFGDIRIGGYSFGNSTLAQAYLPPSVNNYSVAGDIQFNTSQTFNVGSTYDLFTVALHEFGHALGLYHGASGAVMYGTYSSAVSALASDDISGIRSVYSNNAARAADAYDANGSNDTSANADLITSAIDTSTNAGVLNNLNLSTSTDVDWFKFVAPAGSGGTLKVKARASGLSLLDPKVEVYDGSVKLLASNNAAAYGGTASVTYSGLVPGQTYYIKVSSCDSAAAFKTGAYALIVNLGSGADPAPDLPDTQTANGTPLSAGGGQAIVLSYSDTAVTTVNAAAPTPTTGSRAVAVDLSGNYVVAWAGPAANGGGWNVYAQRYDSSGSPLGGPLQVNTGRVVGQGAPAVATDLLGNFVVVWTGADLLGTRGVYAQRYTLLGTKLGGEMRLNTASVTDQAAPSVAMDLLGNFVVAWTSAGKDGSGTGISARRYNLLGLPLSGEFTVNTTTAGDQVTPAVAVNPLLGSFVVTWAGRDAGGSWGIYARRYDILGLPAGDDFQVNTTAAGDQTAPAVAVDRVSGDFVITWTGPGADGSRDIFAQRFDALGAAKGDETRVNTTTSGDQTAPAVALDAGGNAFITWSSYGQDGGGWGVYGQLLTAAGQLHDGEFSVNTFQAGDQKNSAVAVSILGQAMVVWSGNGLNNQGGVYFQRFDLTREALDGAEASPADRPAPGAIPPVAAPAAEPPEEAAAGDAGAGDIAGLMNLRPAVSEHAPAAADDAARPEARDEPALAATPAPAKQGAEAPVVTVAEAEAQHEALEQVADAVFGSLDLLSPLE